MFYKYISALISCIEAYELSQKLRANKKGLCGASRVQSKTVTIIEYIQEGETKMSEYIVDQNVDDTVRNKIILKHVWCNKNFLNGGIAEVAKNRPYHSIC